MNGMPRLMDDKENFPWPILICSHWSFRRKLPGELPGGRFRGYIGYLSWGNKRIFRASIVLAVYIGVVTLHADMRTPGPEPMIRSDR